MTENWKELENKLLMQTTKRVPLVIIRGKGAYVWDDSGKRYLDFVGGWAVDSLGHCHPLLVQAITRQSKTLIQTSNQFYTTPQIKLAQLLLTNSCFNRAFFCNSGAEANEAAIKLARRYGKLHLNGAFEVITTYGSFHGRTLAMVAATGQKKFQDPYIPLPVGFVNVDYNSIEAIQKATNKNTCAVMIEPIQGEGGVNIPDENYLINIREWCTKNGILMILDEVQTGVGRIGRLFGYQRYNVEPDVITLAKGLGGGLPIGAVLAKEQVSVFVPGDHGTTYGGNPLVCAGSLAVTEHIIKTKLYNKVDELGSYFLSELNKLKSKYGFVSEIRGKGLLIGIAFDKDMSAKVLTNCLQNGFLVNAVKPNMIRFMPPLIIEKKHIDEAMNILEKVFILE